jgi:hypothetical protein
MIFLHIIDDFFIQGMCLSDLKQKNWWLKSPEYSDKYKNDYKMALYMHSFSWTFLIMLPIAYSMNWQPSFVFSVCFMLNIMIHSLIDDLKANEGKLSLVADQFLHLGQIILTCIIYSLGYM